MKENEEKIKELFNRIPRRHTADNVKEINSLVNEYEELLQELEANPQYEKGIALLFDGLDSIRATIKKSNDNKASKKQKDVLFDEASGALKDNMEELMKL